MRRSVHTHSPAPPGRVPSAAQAPASAMAPTPAQAQPSRRPTRTSYRRQSVPLGRALAAVAGGAAGQPRTAVHTELSVLGEGPNRADCSGDGWTMGRLACDVRPPRPATSVHHRRKPRATGANQHLVVVADASEEAATGVPRVLQAGSVAPSSAAPAGSTMRPEEAPSRLRWEHDLEHAFRAEFRWTSSTKTARNAAPAEEPATRAPLSAAAPTSAEAVFGRSRSPSPSSRRSSPRSPRSDRTQSPPRASATTGHTVPPSAGSLLPLPLSLPLAAVAAAPGGGLAGRSLPAWPAVAAAGVARDRPPKSARSPIATAKAMTSGGRRGPAERQPRAQPTGQRRMQPQRPRSHVGVAPRGSASDRRAPDVSHLSWLSPRMRARTSQGMCLHSHDVDLLVRSCGAAPEAEEEKDEAGGPIDATEPVGGDTRQVPPPTCATAAVSSHARRAAEAATAAAGRRRADGGATRPFFQSKRASSSPTTPLTPPHPSPTPPPHHPPSG